MKIYTRTGDQGQTSLYDGSRTSKGIKIFEILGEMDELSCRIGLLISLTDPQILGWQCKKLVENFRDIQKNLQKFNSHIATIDKTNKKLPEINEQLYLDIESIIDTIDNQNTKLTKFILPGVTQIDAQAHLCRTQARKVERIMCDLVSSNENFTVFKNNEYKIINFTDININPIMLKYMNRISDFFFVVSRWLCKTSGHSDCFME